MVFLRRGVLARLFFSSMEVVYAHHSITPQVQGILMVENEVSQFPCSAKLNRYGSNIKKKKKSFLAKDKAPN